MVVLINIYEGTVMSKRPKIGNKVEIPKTLFKKFYAGTQKLGDGTLKQIHVYLNCKIY